MSDSKLPSPQREIRRLRSTPNISRPPTPPRDSINLSIPISEVEHISSDIRCCGTHPKLIGFFVKVGVCIFVLGFSMYRLSVGEPCPCESDSAVYISLISSILSYFVGHHTK